VHTLVHICVTAKTAYTLLERFCG